MSYYNTRNSGRFNVPGNFVPASSTNHQTYEVVRNPDPPPAPAAPLPPPPAVSLPPSPAVSLPPPPAVSLPPPPPGVSPVVKVEEQIWTAPPAPAEAPALAAAPAPAPGAAAVEEPAAPTGPRHPFFKTKLGGVRKISNKERRRRQNALLRRITSPKNALMCINELLPNEQITNQFKVEASPQDSFYTRGLHNFRAELVLEGVTYRGHGENKLAARNSAAEQAIRDIVLRKMERYSQMMQASAPPAPPAAPAPPAPVQGGAGASAAQAMDTIMEEEDEALPMIQLLSFALHKLFAEWESAGHHVPLLRSARPVGAQSLSEEDSLTSGPAAAPPRPAKPRKVPDNASSMHPAMLLTILRPQAAYRELSAEGDKPQNMVFTIAVDTEGQTFVGKASSKKDARRAAARAACKAILGITFDDEKN